MSPTTTLFRPEHQLTHAGAVGTPVVNVELALLDADGEPVRLVGRGRLSAAPAHVVLGADTAPVRAWGGPWPDEGRWWDPRAPEPCVRVQVVCLPPADAEQEPEPDPAADLAPDPVSSSADAAGLALLLVLRAGRWSVEGIYE